MKRALLVTVLVMGLTAWAVAQPADGGDRPARPQGPRGGGFNIEQALGRLPEALALTDEQKTKVAPIIDQFLKDHKELTESLQDKLAAARAALEAAVKADRENSTDETKKAVADARAALTEANKPLADLREKLVADLKPLLNEQQSAQLARLLSPRRGPQGGPRGNMTERLLEGITLTDEQKAKIKTITDDFAKQMAALREGGNRPDREKMRTLFQDLNTKIKAVLTEEQVKIFEANQAKLRPQRPQGQGGGNRPARPRTNPPAGGGED